MRWKSKKILIGEGIRYLFPFSFLTILLSPQARAEDPVQQALAKLQSTYWDEVTRECRKEIGEGILIRARDSSGREHYGVLTASHVSQGASIQGSLESDAKATLTFKPDPHGAGSPDEQRTCQKSPDGDPKLARLADNRSDLEWIELERPPEGALFFDFNPNDKAFCLSFSGASWTGSGISNPGYLTTSSSTIAPLSGSLQKTPSPFSKSDDPRDDLLARFSLQYGPRYQDGSTQEDNFLIRGKTFDSEVVNGMSGSPNLHCEKDASGSGIARCCVDGIVRAFHRYFSRTYTSDGMDINALRESFLDGNRGLLESGYRWHYQDGNTVLLFETNGKRYEEMNYELRNSGGGDGADGGESEGKAANSRMKILPGIKLGSNAILGFKIQPDGGRPAQFVYANRASAENIDLIARLLHAKLDRISYPPKKGELLGQLKARLEKAESEAASRMRKQLQALRAAFDGDENHSSDETEDWACSIDMKALKSDVPEIRVKVLRGLSQDKPSYLYLKADSEGVLQAAYDPERGSCRKLEVDQSRALFPVKIPDSTFDRELQVDLRGLFFNDWFQSGDMWSHRWDVMASGLNPMDLYNTLPYIVVQIGKGKRDWLIPCFPEGGWLRSGFPSDVDFRSCQPVAHQEGREPCAVSAPARGSLEASFLKTAADLKGIIESGSKAGGAP